MVFAVILQQLSFSCNSIFLKMSKSAKIRLSLRLRVGTLAGQMAEIGAFRFDKNRDIG
jgi:hypothetical protein